MDSNAASWRLLPFHTGSSAAHFALSDALARLSPRPSVWWHTTNEPTLVLGTGQAWDDVNLEACARAGVLVVRRQAGGTAVLAARGVLGLDVVLPASNPLVSGDVVAAYRWLGELWCRVLGDLGVDCRLVSVEEARDRQRVLSSSRRDLQLACFAGLSPGEVTSGGRKVVGMAQVRRRGRVHLQAGLHWSFDAERLASLLSGSRGPELATALRRTAVGLGELMEPVPTPDDVVHHFHRALQERVGVTLEPGTWTEAERDFALEAMGSAENLGTRAEAELRELLPGAHLSS